MLNNTKVYIPSHYDLSRLMCEDQSKSQYEIGFNDAERKGNFDLDINIFSEKDLPYLFGYIFGMGSMGNVETGTSFLFPDLPRKDFDANER